MNTYFTTSVPPKTFSFNADLSWQLNELHRPNKMSMADKRVIQSIVNKSEKRDEMHIPCGLQVVTTQYVPLDTIMISNGSFTNPQFQIMRSYRFVFQAIDDFDEALNECVKIAKDRINGIAIRLLEQK